MIMNDKHGRMLKDIKYCMVTSQHFPEGNVKNNNYNQQAYIQQTGQKLSLGAPEYNRGMKLTTHQRHLVVCA
jgi:hypothetical protein